MTRYAGCWSAGRVAAGGLMVAAFAAMMGAGSAGTADTSTREGRPASEQPAATTNRPRLPYDPVVSSPIYHRAGLVASALFKLPISYTNSCYFLWKESTDADPDPDCPYDSREYGEDQFDGINHTGTDFRTVDVIGKDRSDPARVPKHDFHAVSAGYVVRAGGGAFNTIAIYDERINVTTLYLHAAQVFVKTGQAVAVGDRLGTQGRKGATAYHVHFEARPGRRTAACCGDAEDGLNDTLDPLSVAYYYIAQPYVIGTNIPDGATEVAVNEVPTVTFSKVMDGATLTPASFTVTGPEGPLAGTVRSGDNVVSFLPVTMFRPDTIYVARIDGAVADLRGNRPRTDVRWTFRTAFTTRPPEILYVADKRGALVLVNTVNGNITPLGTLRPVMTDIAFAPDGSLYGITFDSLYRVDPAAAKATLIGRHGAHGLNALAFRNDGVLFAAGGRQLHTVDLTTGATTRVAELNAEPAGDLEFLPDGALFMISTTGNLVRLSATGGAGSDVGAIGFPRVFGLGYARRNVLYGLSNRNLVAIDTRTGAGAAVVSLNSNGLDDVYGASAVPATLMPPCVHGGTTADEEDREGLRKLIADAVCRKAAPPAESPKTGAAAGDPAETED